MTDMISLFAFKKIIRTFTTRIHDQPSWRNNVRNNMMGAYVFSSPINSFLLEMRWCANNVWYLHLVSREDKWVVSRKDEGVIFLRGNIEAAKYALAEALMRS